MAFRTFALVSVVALTALSLGSLACGGVPDEENAQSSADETVGPGTPTPKSKTKASKEVDKPLVPIYVDQATGAPVAPPAGVGPSAAITLDGNTCSVDKVGLQLPIGSNGWTLTVDAHCPTGVTLQVSGTFDAAYPQEALTAFGSTEATLLTVASPDGSRTDTFNTSSGGESLVIEGPTTPANAAVIGSATIVNADTFASHEIDYDVEFAQ